MFKTDSLYKFKTNQCKFFTSFVETLLLRESQPLILLKRRLLQVLPWQFITIDLIPSSGTQEKLGDTDPALCSDGLS